MARISRFSSVLLVAFIACASPSPPGGGPYGGGPGDATTAPSAAPSTDSEPTTGGGEAPGSTTMLPGDASWDVPDEYLDAVTTHAADVLQVPADDVQVTRAEPMEWTDGSLGCPEPGMVYTQQVIDGFWIQLEDGTRLLDYRLDAAGNFRLCGSLTVSGGLPLSTTPTTYAPPSGTPEG